MKVLMKKQIHQKAYYALSSLFFFLLIPFISPSHSYASDRNIDLTELTLKELMDIEITTVSRKPEKLYDAASAIYVITKEEIRRSSATSIPELLRMVPGVHVAQINSSKWAVSARGFSDLYAKYLLVLLDGRNLYSPLFGGTNWDEIDTRLEDIERIEVIRGPGATMWGADAVNGVVNIITKSANNTQGGELTLGGGNYEEGFGSVRYGGSLGKNAAYRAYVKYFNRDSYKDPPGQNSSDRWQVGRAGFRMDWEITNDNSLTLQGDVYSGDLNENLTTATFLPPYSSTFNNTLQTSGGNILSRWNRKFSETSDMKLQLYFYQATRDDELFREDLGRFDADFQHRFAFGRQQDIVWGLRYNFDDHNLRDSSSLFFDPERRRLNLFSGFIQDEIKIIENELHLIIGTKVEHNHYTDFEIQPSGRLFWKPHEDHTLWASISRAVKTPNRINRDTRVNIAIFPLGPVLTNFVGLSNRGFDSEELIAYEFGYRSSLTDQLFIDIATFYTEYHDLLDFEAGNPFFEFNPPPRLVIPFEQENEMHGHTYGIEMMLNWQVVNRCKLIFGYTWLKVNLSSHLSRGTVDSVERRSPENQFQIRSYIDLPWNMELDSALYYVDHIGAWDIPSYVRFDTRLGWQVKKNLDISFVFQNLFDNHHPEYDNRQQIANTEVERSGYVKMTWKF